ncbi:hypothetical protein [Aromatoleum petrolei]|uniref:Uncharacterized protein n=1 Tax=Aromatoleum petrolei TaxID=76116 RepID=A0ABX1MPK4_9RHOO|nr:hypothetical protein [Aromatoleum petrolei]NMF89887.1 hypothetical protein [Aromatoleum petrolei]QTQ34478.1 Uncharacterized protein ToN1_03000 [Aromatoleum petrolei]
MLNRTLLTGLLALSFAAGNALAHGDAPHSAMKPANGGQVQATGSYQLELVVRKDSADAKDNPVALYVFDHDGNKVASSGLSGSATLLSAKEKVVVPLKADGDNRLAGSGRYASDPAMKAIVAVTVGDKTEHARFTPLQPGDGH